MCRCQSTSNNNSYESNEKSHLKSYICMQTFVRSGMTQRGCFSTPQPRTSQSPEASPRELCRSRVSLYFIRSLHDNEAVRARSPFSLILYRLYLLASPGLYLHSRGIFPLRSELYIFRCSPSTSATVRSTATITNTYTFRSEYIQEDSKFAKADRLNR